MTDPGRYFFVHLQKTAGTALFKRLKHHFGREAVYPLAEDGPSVEATMSIELLRRRYAERPGQFRVVTGHFPLCVTDLLGLPFSTFTILREPVERTLSFLRDNQSRGPDGKDRSLEEIYREPVLRDRLIRNHMVKMLTLSTSEVEHGETLGAMTLVELDHDRLDLAKQNLSERIDVVGLQEDFDGFCAALEHRFGFDLGPPLFANRTQPMDVDDELRQRIARDNELDVELYQFARELVGRRRAGQRCAG